MTRFEPPDPDYERRCRDSFARQAIMATIRGELVEMGPGHARLAMPHGAELTQQHGFLHAGALSTLMDSACGYAALTLMPADAGILTVEFKVSLMAPARGARFTADARVVRHGRTLSFVEGRAWADAAEDRPIATISATMMTVLGRPGITG